MRPFRSTAVAAALLVAALAAAGCGLGPGEESGEVRLDVTRDFGAEVVAGPFVATADESTTVMRLLEGRAEIETRYGGGFVNAIDGLEREESDGRPRDWLYYVNGVEAPIGAAEYRLEDGARIWWDYHDWSATTGIPAVVGSWPQPLRDGYEGRRRAVVLECRGEAAACSEAEARLRAAGVEPERDGPRGSIRVLVGPWQRLADDPAVAAIGRGPEESGVYADVVGAAGSPVLRGLDEAGEPRRRFPAGAGLVAATRRYGGPPVWVVAGFGAGGALAAARLLDERHLGGRFAVAADGGEATALPLR